VTHSANGCPERLGTRCGVRVSTPGPSGLGTPARRAPPCIWTFLSNLGEIEFFSTLLRIHATEILAIQCPSDLPLFGSQAGLERAALLSHVADLPPWLVVPIFRLPATPHLFANNHEDVIVNMIGVRFGGPPQRSARRHRATSTRRFPPRPNDPHRTPHARSDGSGPFPCGTPHSVSGRTSRHPSDQGANPDRTAVCLTAHGFLA
jgi:hypothetical protein